eukprot:12122999-Alexandrium_andersonii.AAC.1
MSGRPPPRHAPGHRQHRERPHSPGKQRPPSAPEPPGPLRVHRSPGAQHPGMGRQPRPDGRRPRQ